MKKLVARSVAVAALAVPAGSTAIPQTIHKAACVNRSFTAFVLKKLPAKCIIARSPNAPFGRAANLAGIRWRSWGGLRAVGNGYELGFHLPYSHIPARVVLSRPGYVEELRIIVYRYFRVTTRYGTLQGPINAG